MQTNNVTARIFIGIGRDRDGDTLDTGRVHAAREWALKQTSKDFGGCTLFESFGAFLNKRGETVLEPALVIETLIGDESQNEKVYHIAEHVRALLTQESVLVTFTEAHARFIEVK